MDKKSSGSDYWPVAFILLLVLGLAASLMPGNRIDWTVERISGAVAFFGPASKAAPATVVLVLSRQAEDKFAVASTLEPRGYAVQNVATAPLAIEAMRRHANGIALVVVDETLPDARKVLIEARNLCPGACPILLKGHREPAQVAGLLLAAMDRHLTPAQARGLRQQALLRREPAGH